MVPDGWDEKHLEDVCDVKGGKRLPKGRSLVTRNTGFPYLRVSDMRMGGVNIDTIQYVPEDVAPKIAAYRISSADLFITVAGTLGLVGEVPSELDGANLTENADKLTNIAIDKKYLLYYLQSDRIQRLIKTAQTQNAQPKLALKRIRKFPVLVPPAREQVRIAETLETWDKAISVLEQVIANKRERKRGLMQVLLTGKKRFKAFQSTGQFERLSIKDIADVDSRQLSSNTAPDFAFDYVSLSDVSQGRILGALPRMRFAEAPSRARKLVQKGDVLLSTVRPNLKGFAMVGDEADSLVVSTGFAVLSVRAGLDPGYLYHYLFSDDITKQIESLVTGSNYPAISTRDVRRLQVNVPTLSEQRMISSVLTTADVEIETLEKQREAYKLQKRGLMQQLLTGKKRAKIEDPEPFSA